MINLTLNQLKRPALSNLVPKFGTKVEKNDINKGGLSTEEVDRNVTLPFELMREVEVSSSDTTTKIQYDAKIAIVGSGPVTLTLDKASYKGCVITITNRSTEQATIVLSEDNQKNIESKKSLVLEWDGTAWNDTALVVDSTVLEESNKPVSSAAVYQKATEITEAYTQADTALGTRIDEEVAARTEAATQLGTRIDTEVGTLSALTTTAKDNVVAAINEVKSDVSTKLSVYTTTMLSGHFVSSKGGYISLKDFWTRLFEKYGPSAEVIFVWNSSETGYVSIDGTAGTDSVKLNGSTIIYYANNTPNLAWTTFGALVIPGGDLHDACIMVSAITDTPGKPELSIITKLARAGAGGGSTYRYTFVVDSNADLTAWANNDRSGGKDYTSVLIRRGTWTSSKGVNLTAAGTKVVVGEAGSKLVFNNTEKGLYYSAVPTRSEYYMRGVTVENTGTGNVYSSGFYLCTNLTNCSGTGTGNAGAGFHLCTNLTNCSGIGTGTNGAGGGFNSCANLTNCSGTGTGTGGSGLGFRSCTNLTNCSGTGTGSGTNHGYGFYLCTNLTNCSGTGTGDGFVSGFHLCTNLTNCSGTGSGSGTNSGYGFNSCTVVIGCKADGHCTTAVFEDCYASNTKTSTYACADTADGGFNNTTNPAE